MVVGVEPTPLRGMSQLLANWVNLCLYIKFITQTQYLFQLKSSLKVEANPYKANFMQLNHSISSTQDGTNPKTYTITNFLCWQHKI
jgi:hypothetical protein